MVIDATDLSICINPKLQGNCPANKPYYIIKTQSCAPCPSGTIYNNASHICEVQTASTIIYHPVQKQKQNITKIAKTKRNVQNVTKVPNTTVKNITKTSNLTVIHHHKLSVSNITSNLTLKGNTTNISTPISSNHTHANSTVHIN